MVVVENGQYCFEFVFDDGEELKVLNEVSFGNYILVVGLDLDNDGLICYGGEVCVEYLVVGLCQEIIIMVGQVIIGFWMIMSYFCLFIFVDLLDQLF